MGQGGSVLDFLLDVASLGACVIDRREVRDKPQWFVPIFFFFIFIGSTLPGLCWWTLASRGFANLENRGKGGIVREFGVSGKVGEFPPQSALDQGK